jgi:hypothetical protein
MLRKLFICVLAFGLGNAMAQELNCTVEVDASRVQRTDVQIFTDLEQSITQFLNNRKWTDDNFNFNERINCNFYIQLTSLNSNRFQAEVRIQSSRPVYGTGYNTVVFNHQDNDWTFEFTQFQPMDFQDGASLQGLTTLLGFYVYLIIGYDFDTFSPLGGTDYFKKALALRDAAMAGNEPGWGPMDGKGLRNRYYLVDNLNDDRFLPLRSSMYRYHMKGLDKITKDIEASRKEIFSSLEDLKEVFDVLPNSMALRIFFNAKREELINLYSKANPGLKNRVIELLSTLDPASREQYQAINKR